jgi:hypothetical protein
MSDDRKRLLWPWIAALLIALPVLYVASFGPACWWLSTDEIPKISLDPGQPYDMPRGLAPHAPQVYWPLGWMAAHAPRPISRVIFWYATAGGKQLVALPCDRHGSSWVCPP